MKRNFKKRGLLLFAIFCVSMVNAFAQDVILKKDGSEVKAKVLEVSDQQIKYKEFDFQTGPTHIINTYEVFMITYENGQKEVFNKQAPAHIRQKPYSPLSMDLKTEFDSIGRNDDKMLNFFKKNNFTEYSNKFESACKMRKTGTILLASGLTMISCGTVGWILGIFLFDIYPPHWMVMVGEVFMIAGNIVTIVSIPISAVAGVKKKIIKNDFARQFGIYTYQPTLNFGLTSHGIGLTLNF